MQKDVTHFIEIFKHLGSEFIDRFDKFVGDFFSHTLELLKRPLLAWY